MTNNLKTVALLGFLGALVWLIAIGLFGGTNGLWIGLVLAVGLNFAAYFFSDKMALAASRAKPVEEHELPGVYAIVRRLAGQADMAMPRIYLIDQPQPNAFATGRNPKHAAVAVTTGIMELTTDEELEGVLAHELAHVANRDILISSVAAMMAAALSIFARMAFWFGGGRDRDNPLAGILSLVALLVAPLAAMVIRLAISRSREYQADASGAALTGQPLQLASALNKIGQASQRIPMDVNPAVSQLFIADPLKALEGGRRRRGTTLSRLFATHPPVEDRIQRLQDMYYKGP